MRLDDFVFPAGTKTGHIGHASCKALHAKAVTDSGVEPFVLYSLRHTCPTRWANAGMDAFTLKYLAGHESISTTMRYIHLAGTNAQDRLAETRARMEARGGDNSGDSRKQQTG
jgi:integrase